MSAPAQGKAFVITEIGRPTNPGFDDYAVRVIDDANAPRFHPGEKLYVNSHRFAKEGDDVVIRLEDGDNDLIAELIRRAEGVVVLRQYNRPGEIELRESSIRSIDVVVLRTT